LTKKQLAAVACGVISLYTPFAKPATKEPSPEENIEVNATEAAFS